MQSQVRLPFAIQRLGDQVLCVCLYLDELRNVAGLQQVSDASVDICRDDDVLSNKKKKRPTDQANSTRVQGAKEVKINEAISKKWLSLVQL